jgi:hypothetical protein
MPWLLDPGLKSLLSMPSLRASVHRPLQPLPPHHNHNLPDLGLCPSPPMPPLTLPASIAQSRRPALCALASAPFPPTPSPLPQCLLPVLLSPSPLPPRRDRVLLLLRQGLSRWPSPSHQHPLLPLFMPNKLCPALLLLPPPILRGQRPIANGLPPMAPPARRLWSSLHCPPTDLKSWWLVH